MNAEAYKKILSGAIENEIEAYEFYRHAAERSADASLKLIFTELAGEELKHRQLLEAFLGKEDLKMNFSEVTDYKIAESVELPALSPDMSFTDGIALAMKKEEAAMVMYRDLAAVSADDEQKNVFLQLSNMEKMHKAKLEELFSNTAYVEAW